MNRNMSHKPFGEIDISDKFFDTLRADYEGFDKWFMKKKDQDAFVQYNEKNEIEGFLYLKVENDIVDDVQPPIHAKRILKVGTFKINAHGTRLGERFIKVISDYAINEEVDVCYVTIFPKHKGLISLVKKFGFTEFGIKGNSNNPEKVFIKEMDKISGNVNADYPILNCRNTKKYLLSIYPKYHSVMFPDSILTTENKNVVTDVSYTNSIHKIYVCTMDVDVLKYGDIVVLYRTAEYGRSAEYSAVATSICTVLEVKHQNEFSTFDEFYKYANQYSVFGKKDLQYWYDKGGCKAIKMTYNLALNKRIVRHDLIEKIGMSRDIYWGFFEMSNDQFYDIMRYSESNMKILG